jgi:hypothetical protein
MKHQNLSLLLVASHSAARLCVGSDPGGQCGLSRRAYRWASMWLVVQRSLGKQVGILVNVFLPHLLHHGFDLIRSVIVTVLQDIAQLAKVH